MCEIVAKPAGCFEALNAAPARLRGASRALGDESGAVTAPRAVARRRVTSGGRGRRAGATWAPPLRVPLECDRAGIRCARGPPHGGRGLRAVTRSESVVKPNRWEALCEMRRLPVLELFARRTNVAELAVTIGRPGSVAQRAVGSRRPRVKPRHAIGMKGVVTRPREGAFRVTLVQADCARRNGTQPARQVRHQHAHTAPRKTLSQKAYGIRNPLAWKLNEL